MNHKQTALKQKQIEVYPVHGSSATSRMGLPDGLEFVRLGLAKWHRTKGGRGIKLTEPVVQPGFTRDRLPVGQVLSYREKTEDGTPGSWVHSPRSLSWRVLK